MFGHVHRAMCGGGCQFEVQVGEGGGGGHRVSQGDGCRVPSGVAAVCQRRRRRVAALMRVLLQFRDGLVQVRLKQVLQLLV